MVDALDGEPGVQSARFLGVEATYPERFDEIFRRLAARPSAPRTARFVAAVCLVRNSFVTYETTGTVEGEIASAPRGQRGFGYDPIFYYPPHALTLAEVTDEEKVAVAHRGRAFRQLAAWLGSRACSVSMKAARPPRRWASAMVWRHRVVLPDPSGP